MVYTAATQAPKRSQFEAGSAPSQAENCGPTAITQIAGFYRDAYYQVEATRRLVTGCCTPTNAWQQRDMLIKRGVPAQVMEINSLAQMHSITDSNRRPIVIGMQMSRVPSQYRDHSFMGWHAVCVMSGGWNGGTRGFWVTDPNFSPPGGIRPDPDRGMKWYPDWVIQQAFINNSPRYSVVPNAAKAVLATGTTRGRGHIAGPNCNIRRSASYSGAIYARSRADGYTYRISDGSRLWRNSSVYLFYGYTGDWARCKTGSGLSLYIHKSVFVVTVRP